MRNRPLRLDEIGYWSELKLDIVKKYAQAYAAIMSNQSFAKGFLYIDAFAGAGTHLSKRTGGPIAGSPRIAMDIVPPFSELHLIDLDGTRAAELRRLTGSDQRVTVYEGDCNRILLDRIYPRCRFEDFKRGLCLLDPYGLNVDWEVLRAAGQMKSVEIFYNFMIMDANMNVFLRNPDRVTSEQAARMNRVWGDSAWRDAVYHTSKDLFGDIKEKASNDDIAEAFRRRLKAVAGFDYVPKPIPMRNSQRAVVYYLYFASPNRTGAKIVDEIFAKYRDKGMA